MVDSPNIRMKEATGDKYWIIRVSAEDWQLFHASGRIGLPWYIGRAIKKRDAFKSVYEKIGAKKVGPENLWPDMAQDLLDFFGRINIDDVVIAVSENHMLLGWGVVRSAYEHAKLPGGQHPYHLLSVDWIRTGHHPPPITYSSHLNRHVQEVTRSQSFVEEARNLFFAPPDGDDPQGDGGTPAKHPPHSPSTPLEDEPSSPGPEAESALLSNQDSNTDETIGPPPEGNRDDDTTEHDRQTENDDPGDKNRKKPPGDGENGEKDRENGIDGLKKIVKKSLADNILSFRRLPAGPPVTVRDHDLPPALNVVGLAEEVVNLIRLIPTEETGSAVGLFGPWGRGKTYLMGRIRQILEERQKDSTRDAPESSIGKNGFNIPLCQCDRDTDLFIV